MNLAGKLAALASSAAHSAYRPRLFSLANADHRLEVESLIDEGRVREVHDRFLDQLSELCATRSPKQRLRGAALDERVRAAVSGRPIDELGTWVYYPWSHRLVHVLGVSDYRELRSSRNRYKITPDEQVLLATKRIGVVGLSVGQASAMTAALEGVGGAFRLADFDELALSNMNRLRSGVHHVGSNKCVIAAREIAEIDPYADVEIFTTGITDDNVEAFLTGGGNLDLVIEECDDLLTKVFLRERARAHGIPVIMETNDRGMLDVERFDLEPNRPVLHDLLRGLSAAELKGLSRGRRSASFCASLARTRFAVDCRRRSSRSIRRRRRGRSSRRGRCSAGRSRPTWPGAFYWGSIGARAVFRGYRVDREGRAGGAHHGRSGARRGARAEPHGIAPSACARAPCREGAGHAGRRASARGVCRPRAVGGQRAALAFRFARRADSMLAPAWLWPGNAGLQALGELRRARRGGREHGPRGARHGFVGGGRAGGSGCVGCRGSGGGGVGRGRSARRQSRRRGAPIAGSARGRRCPRGLPSGSLLGRGSGEPSSSW